MRGVIAPAGVGIIAGIVATPCCLAGGFVAYRSLGGHTRGESVTLDVIELVAWALGSLVGTWIALRLAAGPSVLMGLFVAAVLTSLNSYYFIPARMPGWFWALGMVAGVAPGFLALRMPTVRGVDTSAR